MKRATITLTVLGLALLVATVPSFAQGHGAGGPPPSRGPSGTPGAGAASHGPEASSRGTSDLAHSSPSNVLSHNTAIAGKIRALTGQDAQTACSGFKNLGECVAAAHVAKNLDIAGGFDALRAKLTGPNAESLGRAIHDLKPDANAKAEVKKANKQTDDDLNEGRS